MLRSLCDKAHRWALALLATHLGIFHNPVCSIPATAAAAAAATKLNPNLQPLCAAYLQRLQQNKSMHGRNAKGTDAYVFDDELHDLDEVADNVGDSAKLISMASLDLHARPSCAHDDLGGIRVQEEGGRDEAHDYSSTTCMTARSAVNMTLRPSDKIFASSGSSAIG